MDLEVVPFERPTITLYCDNSGAVANSKEPRSHKRGKHIERKYHLIHEIVNRGDVVVSQIASEDNIAHPFVKGLSQKVFDVARHAKEGDRRLEEGSQIAESLEGDTAEVVTVTTRGRVEVPSRYSSGTDHKRNFKMP